MNKISWQHAEIHYSERGGQNYGVTEETEVLLELINLSYWWTETDRDRQPWQKADKIDVVVRCLFLPKHRHTAAVRINALLNVEVFTLGFTQGCHNTLTHSCFHPNYCIKGRTQDVVYSAEPGTPMTTTFDLRHTLSGKTYLDHREPTGGSMIFPEVS